MARAADEKSVPKLRKAGADRVISLYEAGATKMAQLFGNPNLEEFAEIFAAEGSEVDLADLHVRGDSGYVGRALSDTDFRSRGVIVVGIKRKGELMLPPSSATRIETDDALILLGKSDAIADILTRHH
jgi:voltage-gated potassium channel